MIGNHSGVEQADLTAPPVQQLRPSEVYQAAATSPGGLSTEEAAQRLAAHGRNALQEARGVPLILKLLANFSHPMAVLLWIGGLVAFAAQLPQLGIAVWLVNVINGLFSFWQEFKAERATEALRQLLPSYTRVLRDAQEQRVLAEELVPGDVILLAEGDRISADGRVVQESELRVDQSTLTGESHPVRKMEGAVLREGIPRAEVPNMVFAGTTVAAGTAKAVVTATGMATEFGKIARLTQAVGGELSPLQQEMVRATRVVTVVAVGAGVLFFLLGILLAGVSLAESFIFALGMIVAFVPEGMLPTVTLALALGVQRMARRHALIKRLSAVETLGSTTVICTDKTGTLTQNEMTVRHVWLHGTDYAVSGVGFDPGGEIMDATGRPLPTPVEGDLRRLMLTGGLCNNSRLVPPNGDSGRWSVLGDPTEAALRVLAVKAGLDLESEVCATPELREIPFESRRKRMTTIHQVGDVVTAYVKGAPREILALCSRVASDGVDRPIADADRDAIAAANDHYAREGLRVLAVAQRPLGSLQRGLPMAAMTAENVESDLTFLGLVAMMDPPRPEVAAAVERCHEAGIRVIMITGDYGLTAETIARRIGIIGPGRPRIITGPELDAMTDDDLKSLLAGEVLFARVAPENKLRVVRVLQELGDVVAVTGDGVNDAPALKRADIGVAMGIAGTDVAKEAADMILTDDNFASIVNAVEEGRAVYANIKKFIIYIFTSNAPEAVPFILFVMSGGRIPLALTVMLVLAVDLGTDIVPALALGAEPPEPGLMDHPPRSQREHVIDRALLARAYLWLGPFQALAAMAAFYFYYWTNGFRGQWLDLPDVGPIYPAATAMTFAAIVTTQIGNLFVQRSPRASILRRGLGGNPLIWVGVATELLVAAIIIYVPLFQRVFGTAAFPLRYWAYLFAWAPLLLVLDELRKAASRWRDSRAGR